MATANLMPELHARGLIADVTHADLLGAAMAAGPVPHYAGHDPTATSLHVGHLVPLVIQRRLQLAGHPPIVLIGGATGMIGDPSGKSAERNLLDADTLAANVAGIRAQFARVIDFTPGPAAATLVNNADWVAPMSFLGFLRDVGKHLTVNYMLAKDSVKSRLEERDVGISYTEFSYMLLQAWDFVHLGRALGCRLQLGGSDQWGNITAGIELARKLGEPHALYGLTAPLLLDGSGQKMGKTSTGERIWLDPARTSPYAFYQYWLNVSDDDAARFLRMFSFRPLAELEALIAAHVVEPGKRAAQKTLAEDLTRWVHGDLGVAAAAATTAIMFGGSLDGIGDDVLAPLATEVGCIELAADELAVGLPLIDLLVRADLAASKGEARRIISQGGVYLANQRVDDVALVVGVSHRGASSYLFLRAGKKKYRLVRIVS